MSEEKRMHKVNVILAAPPEWEPKSVADTIYEMIMDLIEDDQPFSEVSVRVDPLNSDAPMPKVAMATLEIMRVYTESLRVRAKEYSISEMLDEGLAKIEHGITDLAACMRVLDKVQDKFTKSIIPLEVISAEDLGEAPREVLHAMAHQMGLGSPECNDMDAEDLADWIKERTSPKRTIN